MTGAEGTYGDYLLYLEVLGDVPASIKYVPSSLLGVYSKPGAFRHVSEVMSVGLGPMEPTL